MSLIRIALAIATLMIAPGGRAQSLAEDTCVGLIGTAKAAVGDAEEEGRRAGVPPAEFQLAHNVVHGRRSARTACQLFTGP
jgi:hypothetical protein